MTNSFTKPGVIYSLDSNLVGMLVYGYVFFIYIHIYDKYNSKKLGIKN